MQIPFLRPSLPAPEEWLPDLEAAYLRKWFTNFGPVHERFTAALEERYCPPDRGVLPVSNCTVGLAASLAALEIQGLIAIPSFSFPATLQAVLMAGCQPCYVDADPQTWELSVEHLSDLLERLPIAAVIGVRSFGFCRDLTPLVDCCRRYGRPLVLDAAAALGGYVAPGIPAGAQAEIEVFSMHATKVFGVGEGGAIFARRDLLPRLRETINFGLTPGAALRRGFNGKLAEVQCALGLAVLRSIDNAIAIRTNVCHWYGRLLHDAPCRLPPGDIGAPPSQTYPVLMPSEEIAASLVEAGRAAGIELRRYYRPALHRAFCSPVDSGAMAGAEALANGMVCLPVLPDMTCLEQAYIKDFCEGALLGLEKSD